MPLFATSRGRTIAVFCAVILAGTMASLLSSREILHHAAFRAHLAPVGTACDNNGSPDDSICEQPNSCGPDGHGSFVCGGIGVLCSTNGSPDMSLCASGNCGPFRGTYVCGGFNTGCATDQDCAIVQFLGSNSSACNVMNICVGESGYDTCAGPAWYDGACLANWCGANGFCGRMAGGECMNDLECQSGSCSSDSSSSAGTCTTPSFVWMGGQGQSWQEVGNWTWIREQNSSFSMYSAGFVPHGEVDVRIGPNVGTVTLMSSVTVRDLTIASNSALEVSAPLVVTGHLANFSNLEIRNGGSVTVQGTFDNYSYANVDAGGTFTNDGTVNSYGLAIIYPNGGTYDGNGSYNCPDFGTWDGVMHQCHALCTYNSECPAHFYCNNQMSPNRCALGESLHCSTSADCAVSQQFPYCEAGTCNANPPPSCPSGQEWSFDHCAVCGVGDACACSSGQDWDGNGCVPCSFGDACGCPSGQAWNGNQCVFLQYTWSGNSDTDWNNSENWVGGNVPPSGADIRIPVVGSGNYPHILSQYSNDGNGGVALGTVTIDDGASLINQAVITGGTFNGAFENSCGYLRGGTYSGPVRSYCEYIVGGTFNGSVDSTDGEATIESGYTVDGVGSIDMGSNTLIVWGGTLDLSHGLYIMGSIRFDKGQIIPATTCSDGKVLQAQPYGMCIPNPCSIDQVWDGTQCTRQLYVWTGQNMSDYPYGSYWYESENWSPAGAPSGNVNVEIPYMGNGKYPIFQGGNYSVDGLTIDDDASFEVHDQFSVNNMLTMGHRASLSGDGTVHGNVTMESECRLNLSAGLTIDGSLMNDGGGVIPAGSDCSAAGKYLGRIVDQNSSVYAMCVPSGWTGTPCSSDGECKFGGCSGGVCGGVGVSCKVDGAGDDDICAAQGSCHSAGNDQYICGAAGARCEHNGSSDATMCSGTDACGSDPDGGFVCGGVGARCAAEQSSSSAQICYGSGCGNNHRCGGTDAGCAIDSQCMSGHCDTDQHRCVCDGDPTCQAWYCGDGTVQDWEQCDDGNVQDGDGCSALCTVEEGFVCSRSDPSRCTSSSSSHSSSSSSSSSSSLSSSSSVVTESLAAAAAVQAQDIGGGRGSTGGTNTTVLGGGFTQQVRGAQADLAANPQDAQRVELRHEIADVSRSLATRGVDPTAPATIADLPAPPVREGSHAAGADASVPVSKAEAVKSIITALGIPLPPRAARLENPERRALVAARILGILAPSQVPSEPATKAEVQVMLRRARSVRR